MKKLYIAALSMLLCLASCTDILDQKPHIGITQEDVYSTVDGYEAMMAKIYASIVLVGQDKGGGNDISSFAGQDFVRSYFNLQEGTTDVAAFRWLSGDNLWNLAYMSWDVNEAQVADTYYRVYYTISLCNELLRYCDKTDGFTVDEQNEIATCAAEARFMRALSYSIILDLFRQGSFVDENTPGSGVVPPAYNATQLLEFIESEINAIAPLLPDHPEYARAGKGAAYTLLARVLLNAEIYTGTGRYNDCIDCCKKVMALGYALEPEYKKLFNGDNHKRTNEIIFAFAVDCTNSTSWGATTYLVHGAVNADIGQNVADYGIDGGWGNFRAHGQFYDLFEEGDGRALFFKGDLDQYIDDQLENPNQGYHMEKFTNLADDGSAASNTALGGVNTDLPWFRLADVYLMAAESVVRGGTGMSRAEALGLVNEVRTRAFGNDSGNIKDSELNLDFLIKERGRELYMELVRRTDLIRFNMYTTANYLWNWKGGVVNGRAVDSRYNIFPIPASEISSNPNLSNETYN